MKIGLNLLIFSVHPMKLGATLMSSFLFNVALVLLACTAAIQFCSQAFSLYANETAIYQIFGNQVGGSRSLHITQHDWWGLHKSVLVGGSTKSPRPVCC
jgi:LMBR1 domain-containing protein 1